jgi:hypothetical protein
MRRASNPVSPLALLRSALRQTCRFLFGLSALACPLTLLFTLSASAHADHDELADFGFVPLRSGSIPMLTILLDFKDGKFTLDHSPAFYRRLLFSDGSSSGTIAGAGGFFPEQATEAFGFGAFAFEDAGVIGPFSHPDNPLSTGDEENFGCARGLDDLNNPLPPPLPPAFVSTAFNMAECGAWQWSRTDSEWKNYSLQRTLFNAISAASRSGFPFENYDADMDGVIESDELVILVVFATSPPFSPGGVKDKSIGAAVRTPFPSPISLSDDLRFYASVATAGQNVSASSIAHELAHILQGLAGGGYYEGYGASGRCTNYHFTTMSCTIFPTPDDRQTFHLDPYTKMRFGFLEPKIAHLSEDLCLRIKPIEDQPGSDTRALILYDPARGPNEYFLLEYRRPRRFNYDGDPWATGALSLPDKGLGIWYVKIGRSGIPIKINRLDGTMGMDRALLLIPPGFAADPAEWGFPASNNGLWGPEDGAVELIWPDGTPAGSEIRVLREQNSELFLEIKTESGPNCVIVPEPTLDEFLRVDAGVDTWESELVQVTREIGKQIASNGQFEVRYTVATEAGPIEQVVLTDKYPEAFEPSAPTLTFDNLVQGQPITLSYSMIAGERSGGFEIQTDIAIFRPSEDPQQPTPPDVYEVESFLSVWDPNEVVLSTNHFDDSDGDEVLDSIDRCLSENAYNFDSDLDGCIDNLNDPKELVEELAEGETINKGIANSLLQKLANAQKSLANEDFSEAIIEIQGFGNQVKALAAKQIPDYEAFLLSSYADTIESRISSMAQQQ